MDIIAAIDAATAPVCGWCQQSLDPDGPSAYYCNETHQKYGLTGAPSVNTVPIRPGSIAFVDVVIDLAPFIQTLNEVYAELSHRLTAVGQAFASFQLEAQATDPRTRALELRRNRNTGPTRPRRAPRTITPRRTR